MDSKYILVDIRSSDEVFSKHFDGNKMTNFYNIPMNMIRFNVKGLESHLQYVEKIFLICRSGVRSQFIKDKYFKDNDKVIVDKSLQFKNFTNKGENTITLDNGEKMTVFIEGTFSFNLYNLTRIIQLMLGSIIIICTSLLWNNCSSKYPLLVLLLFGCMAVFNAITNTCTLSVVFKDLLN